MKRYKEIEKNGIILTEKFKLRNRAKNRLRLLGAVSIVKNINEISNIIVDERERILFGNLLVSKDYWNKTNYKISNLAAEMFYDIGEFLNK